MSDESLPEDQGQVKRRHKIALTPRQWTVLILMAGFLLALVGALLWVLRAGLIGARVDALATAAAGPTPTTVSLVYDAVPTPDNLYWPDVVQPLSAPNAPGGLLWWDGRFAYRRPIQFDEISAQMPAGTWAQVNFDGERAVSESKMRVDGADLCLVVWDGSRWQEITRMASPRRETRGWIVLFHLQDTELARNGHYYLYYGNPNAASHAVAKGAPESSRLLLSLGDEEGVEWGPEVAWTAHSAMTQRLVSPDGRIVIECPAGGPDRNVRVRLRTVPLGEKSGYGPLPDFELHANPPPGSPGASNIVHWYPPLTVTINWAGLPVSVSELESWTHFVHNEETGTWYSTAVEFDRERGLIRFVTDQL
jgi:hypothetical protein